MPKEDVIEVEETVEDQTDEATEDETEEVEWSPPTKESWEKLNKAAAARKADISKLRKELGELKAKGGKEAEVEDKVAQQELKSKRLAGIAALATEGLNKTQARIAVKFLDLSEVDLDEDGEGDFDDAIAELKEAFPQIFEPKETGTAVRRPKVSTGNRGDGGGQSKRDPAMTALLKQAGLLK